MTPPGRAQIRQQTHRLIASRHPTIGVFDDLSADPADLRAAFLLEAITNDRLAAARITRLPEAEIVTGPTASLVMAAFLHADAAGGRFSDGRLGAWYAAFDLETAIAETLDHNHRRLSRSDGGFPNRISMRQLLAQIDTGLIDVRGLQDQRPELYHATDYSASQAYAAALRWPKAGAPGNGIVFDSVRRAGGVNVCVFWPSRLTLPVIQADHFEYRWTAQGVASVVKLTGVAL